MNKLRIALGDSSDKPLYVETIPRKGYSLLVQLEISNRAGTMYVPQNGTSAENAEETPSRVGIFKFSKSDLWIFLGAIGLILTGMLLGAGFMRLWMNHASLVSTHSLVLVLSRFLEASAPVCA